VQGGRVLMKPASRALAVGDWTAQGLPFYAGSVEYRKSVMIRRAAGDRLSISLPSYKGAAAQVFVNGAAAGTIAWEPNEVDITTFVPEGESTVEIGIKIIGHRRNSHGPLHHAEKWPVWTGPGQFVSSGAEWTDGYTLVPCGLMEEPRLLRRMPN
jgi:hypothetical protein